jgi:pilus assembly protein CpaE
MTNPAETLDTVLVVTADKDFAALVATALRATSLVIGNLIVRAPDKLVPEELANPACPLAIADLDGFDGGPIAALAELQHLAHADVRFVAVTGEFSPEVARGFLRLKLNDFLVKPVAAPELTETILRVVGSEAEAHPSSEILSFFPCAGGVGNTTLALQSAILLNERSAKRRKTTCVVDLGLQHGACAEYLDLEPRFDIAEIENQPDRLDRKLLDVMLSRHKSGLAIISAPPCPWEMRSYRPDLVTRLLDLVSSHFDNVVIDMPRTWFPWTDTVLMGSDRIFLVTEMTVPAIRHTQRLANAMAERIGKDNKLGVIVNRVDAKGSANIAIKDVENVLGDLYLGSVANDYKAVREALDQGKPVKEVAPGSRVVSDLTRILYAGEKAEPAWAGQLRQLFGRLKRRPPEITTDKAKAPKAAPAAAPEKRHA